MRIGPLEIGDGHPTYVIAEIGANHDGSLDQAYRLIGKAAEAGADAAKFQFFDPKGLYPGRTTRGAVPEEWLPLLKSACEECGIEFLCSVFSRETLERYLEIKPAAIKIASPEATSEDLLWAAVASGIPLIVSTGAMDWTMLDRTVLALDGYQDVCLLHCVSAYPTPPEELNLRVISAMRERYELPIGFSDHSLSWEIPAVAVTQGACLIEKHLTPERRLPGPDHSFALEPQEFQWMVDRIGATQVWLGEPEKRVQPSEDPDDRR